MSVWQMDATVLHGQEDLRLERVAIPRARDGELIVRVEASLTCGTDLKVYRRGYHATMLKPPVLFGHELAGTVIEVGRGVTEFREGDRVVPLNSAPCDACFFCSKGQPNLCEDLQFNNGAYAEYLRVPARIVEKNTLRLADHVPFEQGALTEPLACVLRGLEESGIAEGDSMIVIGAGPIGLMFIHAASRAGVNVIAVVKRLDQVAAAVRLGAKQALQILEGIDTVQAARALTTDRRGADVVIEAVATPCTWGWAVGMVRKGGVVNFFGGPPSGTLVAFDTNRLHYGELTLKASFHHTPATCRRALELISDGSFAAGEFITNRVTLGEVPALFAKMAAGSNSGASRDIKTAILPIRSFSERSEADALEDQ